MFHAHCLIGVKNEVGNKKYGVFSCAEICDIIEKNDIGEVIGEYVKLQRKGSGYMYFYRNSKRRLC